MPNLSNNSRFFVYKGKIPHFLDISGVFNTTNTTSIFGFDDNGNSVSWVPGNPFNGLMQLTPNTGYYINLKVSQSLDWDDIYPNKIATVDNTKTNYFVDSVNGLDANSGTNQATPFKTLSKLVSLLANDNHVFLKRGSYWREEFFAETLNNLVVSAYGVGEKPVIDGSDVVSNASFTQDATNTNCYTVNWTAVTASSPGNSFRVSVWENGKRLKRAFSVTECNDILGSFYCENQANDGSFISTNDGNNIKVFVNVGSNPIINSKTYECTKRIHVLSLGDNCKIDGIHTTKHGINDGSLRLFYGANVIDCLAEHGTKHNFYIQSGSMVNCVAWKVDDPDCITFIAFTPTIDAVDYSFKGCVAWRELTDPVYAIDQSAGWYSHGVSSVFPGIISFDTCYVYNHGAGFTSDSDTFNAVNCKTEKCAVGFAPQAFVSCNLEKLEVVDCARGINVYGTTSSVSIKNSKFYGAIEFGIFMGVQVPTFIENCVIDTTVNGSYGVYLTGNQQQLTARKNIFKDVTYPFNVANQNYANLTIESNVYPAASIFSVNFAAFNFAQWKSTTGQDANSVAADPQFAIGKPVFFLQQSSPAIALGAGLINQ